MSDTPKLADESKKLLDSGWTICLYRNGLGSFTAVALSGSAAAEVGAAIERAVEDYDDESGVGRIDFVREGVCLTDDFEPSQVLYRLTEKVFGNIA